MEVSVIVMVSWRRTIYVLVTIGVVAADGEEGVEKGLSTTGGGGGS